MVQRREKRRKTRVSNMTRKKLSICIVIIGLSASLAFGVPAFFLNYFWQSLFIALSANLFTSVLAFIFITIAIDKIDEKKENNRLRSEEKRSVLRYADLIKCRLDVYTLYFNELTQPFDANFKTSSTDSFNDVKINNLKDMFFPDVHLHSKLGLSIIESYYRSYNSLLSIIERMYFSLDFTYHESLKESLKNIILNSTQPNGIETLVSFDRNHGNQNTTNLVVKMIADYDGDINKDIESKKYSGNIFLNVILLFIHLSLSRELFSALRENIANIK